jgi:hypothetical protein
MARFEHNASTRTPAHIEGLLEGGGVIGNTITLGSIRTGIDGTWKMLC